MDFQKLPKDIQYIAANALADRINSNHGFVVPIQASETMLEASQKIKEAFINLYSESDDDDVKKENGQDYESGKSEKTKLSCIVVGTSEIEDRIKKMPYTQLVTEVADAIGKIKATQLPSPDLNLHLEHLVLLLDQLIGEKG